MEPLMPVLKGWSKVHVKKGSMASPAFTVRPDSQYKLYESRVPGWIKNLRVTVKGSEETKIKLVNYSPDGTYPDVEYSIVELIEESESDMSSDASLFISKYDPDNKIYTISLSANPPDPYYASQNESFKIIIISPKNEPTIIQSFTYKGLIISNLGEFLHSYASMMDIAVSPSIKYLTNREIIERSGKPGSSERTIIKQVGAPRSSDFTSTPHPQTQTVSQDYIDTTRELIHEIKKLNGKFGVLDVLDPSVRKR